jgi:serine/threonine protein kinase
MGTAGYMAPEQVRGELADPRTDIFAFGAVLYEMLSGQRAFRRDTAAETMTAILKEDPPELAQTLHPISPALDRIMRRCLEKGPEQRFQSARAYLILLFGRKYEMNHDCRCVDVRFTDKTALHFTFYPTLSVDPELMDWKNGRREKDTSVPEDH